MADKIKGTFKDEQGNEFYPHCYSEATGGSTQAVINKVYPVGAIYISTVETSPNTLFGGTWERIQDRFLLAAGSSYTNGSTGGASTHTHTTGDCTLEVKHMPAHSHAASTASAGGHTHVMDGWRLTTNSGSYHVRARNRISSDADDTDSAMLTAGAHTHTMTVNNTGGGTAHNHGSTNSASNMPPYLVVYMWKRTA